MIGKILRNAGSNYANMAVAMVTAFIMSPFFVHRLGDFYYGVWTLAMSFCGYFSLLDLGMNRAIVRYVSQYEATGDHEQLNRFFNTTLVLFSWLGVVAALASCLLAFWLDAFFALNGHASFCKLVVLIAGLNFAFTFPFSVPYAVLIARLEHTTANRINITNTVMRNICIYLVLSASPNLLWLVLVQVFFDIGKNLRVYLVVKKNCPHIVYHPRYFTKALIPDIFGYSVHSFVVSFSSRIINFTDEIVVGSFLRVADVTYYSIATNLVTYFEKIVWSGSSVFVPYISQLDARGEGEQVRESFLVGSKFTLLFTLYLFCGIILLGGDFIGVWMGKGYGETVRPILVTLALAKVLSLGQSMAVARFFGTSRHQLLSKLNFAEAALNLVLSLVLVRRFGMIGVAWGTLIPACLCNGCLLPLIIVKEFKIGFSEYFFKSLAAPVAVSAVVVSVFQGLGLRAASYPMLVVLWLAVTLLYSLLSLLLVFNGAERSYLLSKIGVSHES
ncbi:hypothetical protein GMSM_08840 [Geomonas sp. Red276]